MKPFEISEVLDQLTDIYPPVGAVLRAAQTGGSEVRYAMTRLWSSEGIPYAFRTHPGVYEALRRWLAMRLKVHEKEITIIGSGRVGYSLCPGLKFGQQFGAKSDLDLTIISSSLFERLETDHLRWTEDYAEGRVQPRNEIEKGNWEENKIRCPTCLSRGFIDSNKIPNLERYVQARLVNNSLWEAGQKLKLTPAAPAVRKVSLRVYKDWFSFVRQATINLEYAVKNKTVGP